MNIKELFHSIMLKRKGYFVTLLEESNLNMMQLEVLVYLEEFPTKNTFTEIMKSKDYARSQISSAISGLIDQGFLRKEPHPTNKKIFHLHALEKAKPMVKEFHRCSDLFDQVAWEGVSPEEYAVFERVHVHMLDNLNKYEG